MFFSDLLAMLIMVSGTWHIANQMLLCKASRGKVSLIRLAARTPRSQREDRGFKSRMRHCAGEDKWLSRPSFKRETVGFDSHHPYGMHRSSSMVERRAYISGVAGSIPASGIVLVLSGMGFYAQSSLPSFDREDLHLSNTQLPHLNAKFIRSRVGIERLPDRAELNLTYERYRH